MVTKVSELLALADRMLKAFRKIECFVFEASELEKVRDLVVKAGIDKYVEIRPVDERYPYIFAVVPARRGLDRECVTRIESMLSRGELSHNEYKKYKTELIEQCIISLEAERAKKVASELESYISKLKAGREPSH